MGSPIADLVLNRQATLARQRIEQQINLTKLFAAIDADPKIVGAGVVYIDESFNVVVLREFRPLCSIKPKKIILREAPRHTSPHQYIQQVTKNPRESRIVAESIGMGLSCAGAIIGWVVMISGVTLVPFSAGGSTVVAVAGYAAATASTAQCVNAGMRVYNEAYNPERNDYLDSNEWYTAAATSLDLISLAGAGASSMATIRLLKMRQAATGRSSQDLLRSLSRQERKRLNDEYLRLQNPQITNKMLKAGKRSGEFSKVMSATQVRQATVYQIKDALGASIALAGSAQAGTIKTVAIGLYEEFE